MTKDGDGCDIFTSVNEIFLMHGLQLQYPPYVLEYNVQPCTHSVQVGCNSQVNYSASFADKRHLGGYTTW